MKILLASAHPYMPQIFGGAQSSTHELAVEFTRAGHDVAVLAGLTGTGWCGMRSRVALKFNRRRYVMDRNLGYQVYRAWFPSEVVSHVASEMSADVSLCQSGNPVALTEALGDISIRRFIYLRNVELADLGGDIRTLRGVGFIANSKFTAHRFRSLYGIKAPVVYPLVLRSNYETSTRRRNVTFINPHPHKGVDVALGVARCCQDIPFVFVFAWTLSREYKARLIRRVAALPNVTLRSATRDMKSVYRDARIVLAPSRWEEAFGRIAAEAQYSGIPVVGSRCGGLPEAIGKGGTLVDPDAPIEEWVSAIRSLWDHPLHYAAVSAAAEAHAVRPEMQKSRQIERILRIISCDPVMGEVSATADHDVKWNEVA